MDATLHDLAQLLIKSIPTIVFFIFLAFYLNATYFSPMAKILDERRKQTEGSKELARRAFESADKKASEFERALQAARADISKENDALRRRWATEQAETLAHARAEAEARVSAAKASIADEIERAKSDLDLHVEDLSTRIVETLIRRSAA